MKRIALVCSTAIMLSGCSWFGWGGNSSPGPHKSFGERMNLELAAGIDPNVKGDVIKHDFDNSGTAELNRQGFSDAYGRKMNYQVGMSYEVAPTWEVTAAAGYSQADGKQGVVVGQANGNDITANFNDYEAYNAEFGVRKYFRNRTFAKLLSPAIAPYVGASAGVQHTSSTKAALSSTDWTGTSIPGNDTYMWHGEGYTPTAQVTVGAEWRPSRNFALGLETGLRYTSGLGDGDGSLTNVGWEQADSNGDTLTIPVTLRGRFKF